MFFIILNKKNCIIYKKKIYIYNEIHKTQQYTNKNITYNFIHIHIYEGAFESKIHLKKEKSIIL